MTDSTKTKHILSRGVEQVLPEVDSLTKLMAERPIRVYLGIDPTGSLLTLGHAVALRKLQQFADAGHDAILLVGNGTVRIGDPTGRDAGRPMLTDEQIAENFVNWKEQASRVLDFNKVRILHNGDWLDKLTYADMVKLMAKTTVQQLMERDMFQERLKKNLPIHGHEIMYPLLQGYDSVAMDVDVEIGGSDQLFNMMMGRTLLREFKNKNKWVLTTPLINGTDGRKMSKSFNNFIALTEPAADMYGQLMSVADGEIVTYFSVLTDVSDEEVAQVEKELASGSNPMELKKRLAFLITEQLHDRPSAEAAQQQFESTVQHKEVPGDIPEVRVDRSELSMLELCQLCLPQETNSQLKRLIEQGAVELQPGDLRPTQPSQLVTITAGSTIRLGKRVYFKLVV